jgi:hypothetical protein
MAIVAIDPIGRELQRILEDSSRLAVVLRGDDAVGVGRQTGLIRAWAETGVDVARANAIV